MCLLMSVFDGVMKEKGEVRCVVVWLVVDVYS